jgi:hypothetical protein
MVNHPNGSDRQHAACLADTSYRERAGRLWDASLAMWQNIYDSTQGGSVSADGSRWLYYIAGHLAVLRALTGRDYSIGSDGYLTRERCERALAWAAAPKTERA